ncbi:MJ1255/VC2487 family glycosyltransferase [Alteromonas oceanisediminis]|uniref:MJ1255/VC2487 family glycosyltransferase n=1 Tax=Alteromonas oceanisediminis TaxID=2836180 RepID=UPI001BDAD78E|nr:MJ1255/VC2487 family glycosyltransferase [Alteromonas oceanisediminis]MBT0586849.1 glycosyltransferase [Alteromonas oceanisediminis]
MKIAYGVQGTGNGHITRARIMAKALAQRSDVDVDFFFSGREPDRYFDMQCFGDYRTFTGLSFITEHGKVNQWATLTQAKPAELVRDIRGLDLSQYDLVLNDFEPVTAWAARRQGIPSMSISHQAAFAQGAPKQGAGLIDRFIMQYFAPTDIQMGVHWFHFGQSILPPFIHEKPLAKPSGEHTLVYLPFEAIEDVRLMLEPLSERSFVCFHPAITAPQVDGHIHWYPTSLAEFKLALQHCNGVIANAGFELSSESLQLGKKLLLKPLSGQFEQLSNAQTLSQLGLCHIMFRLDTDSIEEWLDVADIEPVVFPDNPDILIDWLVKRNWADTTQVCEQLWKQVKFPDQTRQKLMTLAF